MKYGCPAWSHARTIWSPRDAVDPTKAAGPAGTFRRLSTRTRPRGPTGNLEFSTVRKYSACARRITSGQPDHRVERDLRRTLVTSRNVARQNARGRALQNRISATF